MIDTLSVRELQKETARVLSSSGGMGNYELVKFNKLAHHDSVAWYKAVVSWYIDQYGNLPSKVGPGVDVKLLLDN
jgi:hypothetical protein